jgi:hypothetical protein
LRTTSTGQKAAILIQASDASFTYQTVTGFRTSATEMFLSTRGGDLLVCRSFLDPQNQPFGHTVPGPMVKGTVPAGHSTEIPDAQSQGSSPVRLPLLNAPYSITNEVTVTM